MNYLILGIVVSGMVFVALCIEAANARQCPTACELERRIEAIETSGYWYPYPPDRDEAEMN